jgi:hypothetical protein
MTEPARILGEPIDEVDDDPHGVLEPSEGAIAAGARKILLRAHIHSPNAQQIADARESARIEYTAQARHAIETGVVR